MSSYTETIRYNLAGLLRFAGRDPNRRFWPWAATVIVLHFAASFALVIPLMLDMFARMARYAAAHQGQPPPMQPGPGGAPTLPPELMPDFTGLIVPGMVITCVTILLLAAAAVRRLHDRNWSGWWALLPLPFTAFSAVYGRSAADAMMHGTPTALVRLSALNSLCYWVALIALVVLLARAGDEGDNHYGPPPPR